MSTEKDREAALRHADGSHGIDHMNVQLAAFMAGVKYAREKFWAEIRRDEEEDIAREQALERLAKLNSNTQ